MKIIKWSGRNNSTLDVQPLTAAITEDQSIANHLTSRSDVNPKIELGLGLKYYLAVRAFESQTLSNLRQEIRFHNKEKLPISS